MSRKEKIIKINGISLTYSEWAKRYGITKDCFIRRLDYGWKMKESVMIPYKRKQYERKISYRVTPHEYN